MTETTLFEDFLDYCEEDNPKLKKDIKIWLAEVFDLPNRNIPLKKWEKKWIKENLTEKSQREILGYTLKEFLIV